MITNLTALECRAPKQREIDLLAALQSAVTHAKKKCTVLFQDISGR